MKNMYTAEQMEAMKKLEARMAAKRAARKPLTLGVQPNGSFNGEVFRADGSKIIVTVPARD